MERTKFPTSLTVLLEPTAACNLRCKHCYHAKTEYDNRMMSYETFDRLLNITAPYYEKVKIIWHGGEPLLVGYDFFEYAYSRFDYYIKKYGTKFEFCIQTNGTLLNEKLIKLFHRTNTIISISYDGVYNDILRQGTEKVKEEIAFLKSKNIKFTCLSTISSESVNHMIELYEYFKEIGTQAKFNPILPDGAAKDNLEFIITKEVWAENFIKFFKYWFFDSECNIYMASCCDILTKYLGLLGNGCLSGTCMFRYVAVDAYGNVYPCGRLIDNNFLLDNVYRINEIREAYLSSKYFEIFDYNKQRANKCKICKWFEKCHSGCNAGASLNGDLTIPYEFECYFNHRVFEAIEDVLKNYEITKINKYAKEILQKVK